MLRAIWWWLPELAVTGGLAAGWVELAGHTALTPRLLLTAAMAGDPGRYRAGAARHLPHGLVPGQQAPHPHLLFSEFIITNRTGSLPLILAARPTPAGERLWVWLRPGLCLADVQDRAEEIAAACWATAVVADLASASNSALVRIDIKRRDPLTGTVASPLAQPRRHHPARSRTPPAAAALDLPDIPADEVTARTERPGPWPQPRQAPCAGTADPGEDDISDWI